MGIAGSTARLLFKEHKYKPLPQAIHLLGRQTIHLGFDETSKLLNSEDITPRAIRPRRDGQTLEGKHKQELGSDHIDDSTFFEMLGVQTIHAIDHSDYEGADIIVDLTGDVPEHLHDTADFIFDGSVMDNIFDPAAALRNVSRILKP